MTDHLDALRVAFARLDSAGGTRRLTTSHASRMGMPGYLIFKARLQEVTWRGRTIRVID